MVQGPMPVTTPPQLGGKDDHLRNRIFSGRLARISQTASPGQCKYMAVVVVLLLWQLLVLNVEEVEEPRMMATSTDARGQVCLSSHVTRVT